jgi:hypothetical protein
MTWQAYVSDDVAKMTWRTEVTWQRRVAVMWANQVLTRGIVLDE